MKMTMQDRLQRLRERAQQRMEKRNVEPMTVREYRRILADLGMTQATAAACFGRSPRQGRRWASGETAIPPEVADDLRAMHQGKIPLKKVGLAETEYGLVPA